MRSHEQYDLKDLERRAFRSTFQDGLWDIYLGLIFVSFGSVPVLRGVFGLSSGGGMAIHISLITLALVLLIVGKRVITTPRLGFVKFGVERQRKLSKVRVVLMASFLVGLILFAVLAGDSIGLNALMVAFAASILITLGAMAYYMDYDRLFIYAILWAASMPVGLWMEENAGLSDAPAVFILTGGVAVVVGVIYLQRFLHDYHLPPQDA